MRTRSFLIIAILGFAWLVGAQSAYAVCTNPEGVAGSIKFNKDFQVMQYCDDTSWRQMGPYPVAPKGCPNIGDVCTDGSVYAGLSPDENLPMYTTPADAPELLAWNNGNSTGKTATGATGNVTGEAYTATIAALDADSVSAGFQPHQAAKYCADLTVHGQDDWYLPSQNEFNLFDGNFGVIGGFTPGGSCSENCYWISKELNSSSAIMMHKYGAEVAAATGGQAKEQARNVRCVRRQGNERTSIVSDGLIGHWRLDETSGTTALDSSGNGYDGNMASMTGVDNSTDGKVLSALEFDGTSDEVCSPVYTGLQINDDLSMAAWFRADSFGGGEPILLHANPNPSANEEDNILYGLLVNGAGGIDYWHETGSGVNRFYSFETNLSANVWHHVALTRTAGTGEISLYLNGRLFEAVTGVPMPTGGNTGYLCIAENQRVTARFDGAIDDIRIYNRTLTGEEINYLASSFDANVTYDTNTRVPKYFNGNDWVAMGEAKYVPNAVHFEADEYLNKWAVASDDSKAITGSFWIKLSYSPILGQVSA